MAQSGYTPIQLYYSSTPTNAPAAGNLANGELAINTADGKLFYKDSGGNVQTIATKSAAAGTFAGSIAVNGTSSAGADIKLYEDTDNGTNYVSLKAANTLAANVTWTLPTADGTSGQAIVTDGAGNLTFATRAALNASQTFTAPQRGTVTTDNDGSFDLSVTNNFACTPTGNVTLTFTNMAAGQSGFILFVNGSNYTVSAHANTKVSATALSTLSATGTYLISYWTNGTNTYIVNSAALS